MADLGFEENNNQKFSTNLPPSPGPGLKTNPQSILAGDLSYVKRPLPPAAIGPLEKGLLIGAGLFFLVSALYFYYSVLK